MGSLEIGSSALNSFRVALDVTSQNIANANTVGYSRQRADLATTAAVDSGKLNPGSGVHINDIQRIHDEFLGTQVRDLSSDFQRLDSFHQLATRIDSLVADDQASLTPALQSFFNSIEQLNTNPASVTNRTVVLGEARSLVDRFKTLDTQLGAINTEVNARIESEVNEINSLATSIADLNTKIAATNPTDTSNELLDTRAQLLKELSGHIAIQTTEQNGKVDVRTVSGMSLVSGDNASKLSVVRNSLDSQQLEIASEQGLVSHQVRGGALGGVMDFRREMLNPIQNEMGRIATVLARTFNDQHNQGIDLNGAQGADFFSINEPISLASATNTGNASITTEITNTTQLTSSDYSVSYDGTDFTVTRLSDNNTVTTNSATINLDGLKIDISGTAQAGDEFLIRPTQSAAKNIGLNITNTSEIAVASPLRATASVTNSGNSSISNLQVTDPSNANLTNPVEIRFSSSTDYELFDTNNAPATSLGTGTLTTDNSLSHNGWTLTLSGTPNSNSVFTVEQNSGGQSDNSNGSILAGLQFNSSIGGHSTFQEGYSQLVNLTGQLTRQAGTSLGAQKTLLTDVENRETAVSGVNLDEEAVNLTRYQQAYQAAAQVINTSQNMFDTILGVVGR